MKKYLYPLFAIALLTAPSCKKSFFDINENQNSPIIDKVDPNLILPRSLQVTGARIATNFDYAAMWTGYWSRSGTYGQSIEQESYNITTSFQSGQWSGWYDILNDENIMEQKAKASGNTFYEAAAKTLKAIGFMYLVDQYNNVPYSKAFDIQGNLLPSYDKAENIYADLFVQLDAAAKLFKNAKTEGDLSIPKADIMFGGDTQQWRKFINTLRLKLLLHESEVVSASARQAVIAQINADGAGFIGANETAAVNPGYAVNVDQQNPFYDTYKTSPLGVLDQYNRANNYILYKYYGADGRRETADDDVRFKFVFSKVNAYVEDEDGNPVLDPTAGPVGGGGLPWDYRGTNFGQIVSNADPYRAPNQSDVAGPGLAKSPTQDQPVITSVESLFMQAEAQQRGWISGNALETTKDAIRESYSYLGAPADKAEQYITSTIGTSLTVEQIVYQKYLSLIGLDNFEAYVDYRRLGVPSDLPLSQNTNRLNRVIPLRLAYPQSEYQYNSANVAAQGAIDTQTSRIFWDK
ncbi:SusD/RagB family nutrient-binding outer membrane lipoprotein [Mucilaginibacter sp. Bleaf8]|uniref:SusD/RagB family nutrient-binding outer membrane lipoprotein n=1 Tax=Mucilaginibacter sp. Bleaf8 TaxID=2834430 RepID=UPI001BCD09AC|nr:SusD/RagB family nutrient-binding outer membrane lipoprotein [Mucilaginibacter sp. Bleaf8]MBS7564373.1 SusD/RagB family nutrient-binding outer membrane lipoprotein [Mucilaginibacter sp. Bleaf8]